MLNQYKLNKILAHKTPLAFITFALLIAFISGCGKRKPPLPPRERVSQRVEIKGAQQGNQVVLSWTMPARNASQSNTLNIDRIDVYRLIEPLSAPLSLSEDDFASRSTLIKSIPVTDEDFGLKNLNYTDTLEFSGQAARLRYAIRFVNNSGQKAVFSNFLLIQPQSRIAENPTDLNGTFSQDSIVLRWQKPTSNVDGTQPANILGYNVYRRAADDSSAKLLNKTPLNEVVYSDDFFDFGTNYAYFVRTVSLGSNGAPIESLNSNIIEISPVDTFAPKPPDAITIAAAPNVISIFFAANVETDIAGYKIYRSTDQTISKESWEVITPEILKNNTFADTKVIDGTTYYYYVIAVDNDGNESEPSDVVSETAL